jgi:hypothetical protein
MTPPYRFPREMNWFDARHNYGSNRSLFSYLIGEQSAQNIGHILRGAVPTISCLKKLLPAKRHIYVSLILNNFLLPHIIPSCHLQNVGARTQLSGRNIKKDFSACTYYFFREYDMTFSIYHVHN